MVAAAVIRSMTGFGQGAAEDAAVRVEVELKGVNHRFLDLKMKLPSDAAGFEPALRARVQSSVSRGRIDVTVALRSRGSANGRVEVNRDFVAAWLRAAAEIKKEFRLKGVLSLPAVAALPGAIIVQAADGGVSSATARPLIEAALDEALAAYDAMRLDEGRRLVADLSLRLTAIAAETNAIEEEASGLPAAYAGKLRERVAALARGGPAIDESRLAQEVALLADRVDISEEIVRLKGYVEQARGALERPQGPVGKTLDFVMQEMNREANTLSSKSEALSICQAALRIKSEVEKIREQVQNLE